MVPLSSDELLTVRVENGIAWRLRAVRLVMTGTAGDDFADARGDDEPAPVEDAAAGVGWSALSVALLVPAPSHAVVATVTKASAAPTLVQRRNSTPTAPVRTSNGSFTAVPPRVVTHRTT